MPLACVVVFCFFFVFVCLVSSSQRYLVISKRRMQIMLLCDMKRLKSLYSHQIIAWFNRKTLIIIYLWLIDSKSLFIIQFYQLRSLFWKEIFLLAICNSNYLRKTHTHSKIALNERKRRIYSSWKRLLFLNLWLEEYLRKYFQRKSVLS